MAIVGQVGPHESACGSRLGNCQNFEFRLLSWNDPKSSLFKGLTLIVHRFNALCNYICYVMHYAVIFWAFHIMLTPAVYRMYACDPCAGRAVPRNFEQTQDCGAMDERFP